MKKTISQIYLLSKEKNEFNDSLIDRYNEILDKTPEELNDADISFLLRQKKMLNIAIPKAIERLSNNPNCGGLYEGEMIYSLSRIEEIPNDYVELIKNSIPKLENMIDSFNFEFDDDKKDVLECLFKIKENSFKNNG